MRCQSFSDSLENKIKQEVLLQQRQYQVLGLPEDSQCRYGSEADLFRRAESGRSLRLRVLWCLFSKAAIHRGMKHKNTAVCLKSALSPNYQLSAVRLTSAPSSCDDWTQTFTKLSGEQHRPVRPQRDFSKLPIRLWLLRRPQPTDAVITEWAYQEPQCR